MADVRSTLIWLAAGFVGMFGLALVVRFGAAVGMAMIVAISIASLAGAALRPQAIAISGLLSGFGILWLMVIGGEALVGTGLHGSITGHAIFGIVVMAVGMLLGIWHLATASRTRNAAELARGSLQQPPLQRPAGANLPLTARYGSRISSYGAPLPARVAVPVLSEPRRRRLQGPPF